MRITRYNFGEGVSLRLTKAGDAVYWRKQKYYLLGDSEREVSSSDVVFSGSQDERGPFQRSDFGDRDRFVWAAGACAIAQDAKVLSWGQRYAIWTERNEMVLVDATRAQVVYVGFPMTIRSLTSVNVHGETMWVETATGVLELPVRELEGLFDHTSDTVELEIRELYPNHRPKAQAARVVRYVFSDRAMLDDEDGCWTSTSIPVLPGLREGTRITLYDELMKDVFLECSIDGGPRRPVYDEPFPTDFTGSVALRIEPAIDPAGELVKASPVARSDDLDRVFGLLADDPEDEAARLVVVDLLEDAGEPYAPLFAKLLAGEAGDEARREALGTFANYVSDVYWHGNLPRGAWLSIAAPLDDELGELVAADFRLGFFHTLRLGEANFRLYSKLIASPRAAGLRHVDGSRAQILTSLIAAKKTGLRRLSGVKFAQREVIEALADSTFDRVVEIETETQARVVGGLLDYIARDEAKFFARAPRHLFLVEKGGNGEALAKPILAAWDKLPLEKLTFGGVTIARDGTATADEAASEVIRRSVASRFRLAGS